jgi:hypothetical protein
MQGSLESGYKQQVRWQIQYYLTKKKSRKATGGTDPHIAQQTRLRRYWALPWLVSTMTDATWPNPVLFWAGRYLLAVSRCKVDHSKCWLLGQSSGLLAQPLIRPWSPNATIVVSLADRFGHVKTLSKETNVSKKKKTQKQLYSAPCSRQQSGLSGNTDFV